MPFNIPIFGSMFQKNNLFIGLAAGLIFPGIAWVIFALLLKNRFIFNNQPLIPYVCALAINLLIARSLFKNNADKTGTGLMASTFVAMMLMFYFQRYLA